MKEYCAIGLLKVMSFLVNIVSIFFPVKSNKAVFVSFSGKNYDSNPKYFYEYLLNIAPQMEYVWAFNTIPNVNAKGCRQVKYGSIRYFLHLFTARYWFFDVGLTRGLSLSNKRHVVIHFLHGTPVKKCGGDMNVINKLDLYGDHLLGSIANYILSQGRFTTKTIARAYNVPEDKFLEIGAPRTDCLFDLNNYVLENNYLSTFREKKTILYLPTMREWKRNDDSYISFLYRLNLSQDQYLFFKSHPSNRLSVHAPGIIDVSDITSLNDLYCISDVLITDYSSALFDYALTGRPIILYQNDYDDYVLHRGLYFERGDLDLVTCTTEEELLEQLSRVLLDKEYYNLLCEKTRRLVAQYVESDSANTCKQLYSLLFKRT